jgi:hypothetical protein
VVAGSEGVLFYRTNTGLMGSNPFRGTDICLSFFLFLLSHVGAL